MTAHRDLRAVLLGAVVCALIAVVIPFWPVRVLAAVPLLLLLPGFAVTQASFARNRPPWPMLPMLSIGLSLSLLAVGVVVLHVLPGRFGEASWVGWALLVTLAGCLVAAARRPPAAERTAPAGRPPRRPRRLRRVPLAGSLPREQTAMLAVAGLALIATVFVSAHVWPARNAIGYTRLWMLPSKADAKVPHVTIGVENDEHEESVYRLVLDVGGVKSIRRMDLDPGRIRIWRVRPVVPDAGKETHVVARLYIDDDPYKVYRRVTGWIPARR
jgi:uncharacterized membrane protein